MDDVDHWYGHFSLMRSTHSDFIPIDSPASFAEHVSSGIGRVTIIWKQNENPRNCACKLYKDHPPTAIATNRRRNYVTYESDMKTVESFSQQLRAAKRRRRELTPIVFNGRRNIRNEIAARPRFERNDNRGPPPLPGNDIAPPSRLRRNDNRGPPPLPTNDFVPPPLVTDSPFENINILTNNMQPRLQPRLNPVNRHLNLGQQNERDIVKMKNDINDIKNMLQTLGGLISSQFNANYRSNNNNNNGGRHRYPFTQ